MLCCVLYSLCNDVIENEVVEMRFVFVIVLPVKLVTNEIVEMRFVLCLYPLFNGVTNEVINLCYACTSFITKY